MEGNIQAESKMVIKNFLTEEKGMETILWETLKKTTHTHTHDYIQKIAGSALWVMFTVLKGIWKKIKNVD